MQNAVEQGKSTAALLCDPATREFSAFHCQGEALLAVDSINCPEDHMPARKLLDQGLPHRSP